MVGLFEDLVHLFACACPPWDDLLVVDGPRFLCGAHRRFDVGVALKDVEGVLEDLVMIILRVVLGSITNRSGDMLALFPLSCIKRSAWTHLCGKWTVDGAGLLHVCNSLAQNVE